MLIPNPFFLNTEYAELVRLFYAATLPVTFFASASTEAK